MTLQQFLKTTAGVPVPRLRQAIAAALTVEPARSTAEYRRFYRRVIDALTTSGDLRGPVPLAPRETSARTVAVTRPAA